MATTMIRALLLLLCASLVGCFRAHGLGDDDGPPVIRRTDAAPPGDPGRDLGPIEVDPPPPTGCGAPDGLPESMECVGLCQNVCNRFASCGGSFDDCLAGCFEAYRCPGETPGHDAAICMGAGPDGGCPAVCAWVPTFGGFGTGPVCAGPVDPPAACAGRDFCDCGSGCDPLIDLTTGCICPCDDPFNCSGELCDCACGGATYLGCASAGQCATTQLGCEPGERAVIGADGCPVCASR